MTIKSVFAIGSCFSSGFVPTIFYNENNFSDPFVCYGENNIKTMLAKDLEYNFEKNPNHILNLKTPIFTQHEYPVSFIVVNEMMNEINSCGFRNPFNKSVFETFEQYSSPPVSVVVDSKENIENILAETAGEWISAWIQNGKQLEQKELISEEESEKLKIQDGLCYFISWQLPELYLLPIVLGYSHRWRKIMGMPEKDLSLEHPIVVLNANKVKEPERFMKLYREACCS